MSTHYSSYFKRNCGIYTFLEVKYIEAYSKKLGVKLRTEIWELHVVILMRLTFI